MATDAGAGYFFFGPLLAIGAFGTALVLLPPLLDMRNLPGEGVQNDTARAAVSYSSLGCQQERDAVAAASGKAETRKKRACSSMDHDFEPAPAGPPRATERSPGARGSVSCGRHSRVLRAPGR